MVYFNIHIYIHISCLFQYVMGKLYWFIVKAKHFLLCSSWQDKIILICALLKRHWKQFVMWKINNWKTIYTKKTFIIFHLSFMGAIVEQQKVAWSTFILKGSKCAFEKYFLFKTFFWMPYFLNSLVNTENTPRDF